MRRHRGIASFPTRRSSDLESGFGREGGREGMWEYLKPVWDRGKGKGDGVSRQAAPKRGRSARLPSSPFSLPPIDRTYKMFIDRKSTRLNSSHRCISYAVFC